MSEKTLYLVDLSSFIFRAYYAIRPLTAPDGTPVNAVYGVVSMLNKLIAEKKPDHLVICGDRPEPGFRHEIYPEYKANRRAPPEDLVPQFALIQEFIKTYPLKIVDKIGYEADDVIATLVHRHRQDPQMIITIVSSDKDLMQLIGERVSMYDTMKEKVLGPEAVLEKFGVPPEKVVDVQSLCGDPTDNIPGARGIGPKTAAKLIGEYGSLETVLERAQKIPGKVGERLVEDREKILVSKKLVTLVHDVPLDINWDNLSLGKPDAAGLKAFYQKLGFKKLALATADPEKTPQQKSEQITWLNEDISTSYSVQFSTIDTVQKLQDLVKSILQEKPKSVAFDTETDGLDVHQAKLVGMSLCYQEKEAYYVPIGHAQGINLSVEDVARELKPIFEASEIKLGAQNAKFDIHVLSYNRITIVNLSDDSLIASYLIDPEGPHNLDYLAQKYLHYKTVSYSEVVPKGKTFADVPVDLATRYSAEDSWVVFKLLPILKQHLADASLTSIYESLEVPLVLVLGRMERHGILLDLTVLETLSEDFLRRLERLKGQIYQLAGEEFNINSPKQLGEILFEKLKLPTGRKTKSGFSTDVDVLTDLAPKHDLPRHLLEYRTLSKLQSTYVEGLKAVVNPRSKRVHTSFNQSIAATGRLSSTDPNLQNIPIRGEEGRKIREAFVAPPGHFLLSADYSQIELRLLAAFSEDPNLVEAYQKNLDVHARTAAHIFGLKLEEVDGEHRAIGKTVNFGVIYGQSPFGLSQQLDVPQAEAKQFIESFYQKYATVRDYKETVLAEARRVGYVASYLGRRRYLPDLNSHNKLAQQNAERAAFNTVFQGSAADLIKKAMILIDEALTQQKMATKMLLQVHDELVFEVPKDEVDAAQKVISKIMESAFSLSVPLKISCKIGKNWADAH